MRDYWKNTEHYLPFTKPPCPGLFCSVTKEGCVSSGLQRTDQLFWGLKASKTDVKRVFWTRDNNDRPSTVGNMGVSFYEPEYTVVVVSRGGRGHITAFYCREEVCKIPDCKLRLAQRLGMKFACWKSRVWTRPSWAKLTGPKSGRELLSELLCQDLLEPNQKNTHMPAIKTGFCIAQVHCK